MDFANSQPINPVDMGQPIFMIRSFRESKFDQSISPVAFDKPMRVEVSMVPFHSFPSFGDIPRISTCFQCLIGIISLVFDIFG